MSPLSWAALAGASPEKPGMIRDKEGHPVPGACALKGKGHLTAAEWSLCRS